MNRSGRDPTLANLCTWMLAAFFLTAAALQGCVPEPAPDLVLEVE